MKGLSVQVMFIMHHALPPHPSHVPVLLSRLLPKNSLSDVTNTSSQQGDLTGTAWLKSLWQVNKHSKNDLQMYSQSQISSATAVTCRWLKIAGL